jgi:hypothetical protein
MKTRIDASLRREATQFSFRFACDDCAHFDPDRERCSFGFVAAPRRDALNRDSIESCKTFELT